MQKSWKIAPEKRLVSIEKWPIILQFEVGDGLMGAFRTTNTSDAAVMEIPFAQVNLLTGEAEAGWLGSNSLLAEMGTIQLEMRQLSHYTTDRKYADAADRVSHLLQRKQLEGPKGLWNTYGE